jgi:hypothetical protein
LQSALGEGAMPDGITIDGGAFVQMTKSNIRVLARANAAVGASGTKRRVRK